MKRGMALLGVTLAFLGACSPFGNEGVITKDCGKADGGLSTAAPETWILIDTGSVQELDLGKFGSVVFRSEGALLKVPNGGEVGRWENAAIIDPEYWEVIAFLGGEVMAKSVKSEDEQYEVCLESNGDYVWRNR